MKCSVCGARMSSMITDLPFKLADQRIVIIKQLPVLQCRSCRDREYLIEDAIMRRIDVLLMHADSSAELEVLRYAT